ncbi:hypothetical protein PIB30_018437 [Stylosanthes scabra]|uniref:Uncharacterized protein n=1 Tax=Stylosanthes scabra TaxID=79078 RepID=A0ABU6U869_9FABA|nr:hypothetical protein [Stylosanthes scabra]
MFPFSSKLSRALISEDELFFGNQPRTELNKFGLTITLEHQQSPRSITPPHKPRDSPLGSPCREDFRYFS